MQDTIALRKTALLIHLYNGFMNVLKPYQVLLYVVVTKSSCFIFVAHL